MRHIRGGAAAALAVATAVTLAACNSSGGDGNGEGNVPPTSRATPKNQLQQSFFSSCQDFRNYYAEQLTQEYLTGYAYGGGCFGCEIARPGDDGGEAAGDADGPVVSAAPPAEDRTVTETNTQESGVDEADLVESDPDSADIYFLQPDQNRVLVIDTTDPAAPRIRSRIALESPRRASGMYLDTANNRLAVLLQRGRYFIAAPSVSAGIATTDAAVAPPPEGSFEDGSEVLFFDVSNPDAPTQIASYRNDGNLIGSRRVDDRIHLVTEFAFPAPHPLQNDDDFIQLISRDYPQARREGNAARVSSLEDDIRNRVTAAVNATGIASLLPREAMDDEAPATLDCASIQRPEVDTRLGMLMISSIDTDGSNAGTIGTINNAWDLYASQQNLYLLQNSGGWWFDEAQRQQTAIYRYEVGDGTAQPRGVAAADGWVQNSYQLSEHEGFLRVAATEGRFQASGDRFRQINNLMVFDIETMELASAVRDFVADKPQETIRAVRFLGDRGFVVTFEFTDPLFAFDLSEPRNPVLAGQVEIPGFATYIEPLSDDFLLTIGRAGGENGVGVGNSYQLRIFDVSTLSQPTPLASEAPTVGPNDYVYSLAEYEPLAFTFLPDSERASAGLLSIPAQISSPSAGNALSGFVAYRVDALQRSNGINEYARIDHKETPDQGGSQCPPQREERPPEGCDGFAPVIYSEPLRSVIARESNGRTLLFTFSSNKLKVVDTTGAQAVDLATLPFADDEP